MISIGIPYNIAGTLNPRKIRPFEKAFNNNQRKIDENYWLLGQYMSIAVACANSSENEYPKKPIMQDYYEDLELTEEERDNKELEKMLLYEELWHNNDKQLGLPELDIK